MGIKTYWIRHYSKKEWQEVYKRDQEVYRARYKDICELLASTWYPPNNPSNIPQMLGIAYGIGLALGLRKVISVNN